MIPRLKPYYNKRELLAAFTPSKGKISKYENSFAETFGCKYGTMFSYGRTALYALFKAWKLNDHEIICPAYTCVVVQHSIVLSGNVPVFVDCEKGSYNMSYEGLKDAITERTRAVIVTHLFGYPMDVNLVQSIIKEAELKYGNKIYVVQDAAHSFGCKWEGEMVTQFGDAAIFGLNVSKIINSVFGGIAITNSENTHKGLREFRSSQIKPCGFGKTIKRLSYLIAIYIAFNPMVYRITIWLERLGFLDKFILYYDESKIEFPADWDQMPSELEARVGLIQLQKYDSIVVQKALLAKQYIDKFKDRKDFALPTYEKGATYSHFVAQAKNREKTVEKFRKRGIQLGILIEYSVPEMKAYKKYKKGEYPIAKSHSESTINFPIWPGTLISNLKP